MDQTRSNIAHLYRRAGFGATPTELDQGAARGYAATVEMLLAGLHGPDLAGDKVPVPTLSTPEQPGANAAKQQLRQEQNQQYQALQRWWLDRMIASSTPLREKMALLWHGHFATGFTKVKNAALMYRQNQLFRTMGGGSFETLVQAVAKDPAMMIWLDTRTNVSGHPNENFARELMELFTLGLGNFSEDDVQQAARAFTGWYFTLATGEFVLRAARHDGGSKSVLGQTGNLNGTDVIHIITRQPASARFIVAKIWSHLAYPVAPTDPIIGPLVDGYRQSLDITALLRAIFLHPAFTGPAAKTGLVKQPIEYVVGLARSLGINAEAQSGAGKAVNLVTILTPLGQIPFNPSNVGGWPQNGYWLTTATSLTRLQLGLALAARLDLSWLAALAPSQRPDAVATRLSIDGWGQTTAAALSHAASDPAVLLGLALSAPEYVLN